MAIGALRHLVFEELGELSAMYVFVALLALFRSLLKVDIDQLGLKVGRLVTIDAGHCSMRSRQREGCCAVIKAVQFFPGLGGMASLATQRLSVLPDFSHPIFELVVMHVFVTTGAQQIVEAVGNF